MPPLAIWITGLPGSGKSTLAHALAARHPEFALLKMDDLRRLATPQPTYREEERELLYRSFVYAARVVTNLGHPVILDATANRRRWRELARRELPCFAEVYLKCALEVCARRERMRGETLGAPPEIYRKAGEGWPVPGVNVPYEEPLSPELVIDTGMTGVEESLERLEGLIRDLA